MKGVGIAHRALRWISLVALCAIGWYLWVVAQWRPPDTWNPLAPLHIADTPGPLTRFKLGRLDADPQRCLSTLRESGFRFVPAADIYGAPGCGYENAVRISRTALALSSPLTLSCPAAVSLALWERHVLQVAAQQYLERAVTRIDHLGSYSCRNIYGRDTGPRSRHANADAVDIAGFALEGAAMVRVRGGWNADAAGDVATARFLRAVRDGGCRYFDGVLSPEYNAAHADHLHFERHGHRICR